MKLLFIFLQQYMNRMINTYQHSSGFPKDWDILLRRFNDLGIQ